MRGSLPIWPLLPHCPGITLPQYSCHQDPTESESHRHPEPFECSALFARANGVTVTSCDLLSVSPSSASAASLSSSMAKRRPRRRSSVVYPTPPSTTSSAKHAVPLPVLPDHECGTTADPPSSCPTSVAPSIAIVSPPSPSPLSPPPTSPIPVLSLPTPDDDSMTLLSRPFLRLTASAPPLPRLTTGLLIPDPSLGSHALLTPLSPVDRPPAPLDSIPEVDDETIRMERSSSSDSQPPIVVVNHPKINDHNGAAMDLDMCEDAESPSLLSFPYHHQHSPAPSPMTSNLGLFWDEQPVDQMPSSPHRPTADLPDLGLFSPPQLFTSASDASCHDHTLPWGLSIPQTRPDYSSPAPPPSLLRIPQNPLASRWSPDTSSPSPGPDDEGESSGAPGRWDHPSTPSPRLPTWDLPDLNMECYDPPDAPAWTSESSSSRASTLESICVATPDSVSLEPSIWPEIQDPASCAPSPRPTPKGLPPLVEIQDEDCPMTSAEAEILLTSPSRQPVNLPTLTLDTRPQFNVVDNESVSRNMYHHTPGHPVYNAHFTTEPETLSGFSTPNMISPLLRAFPAPGADTDLLPALPLPELKRARSWPMLHPATIALSEPPPRSSGLGLELGAPATPPSRECDLATDPLLRELGLAQAPAPQTEMGALYGIRKRSLDAERTARGTEARIAARIRSLEASLLARMHNADSDSGSSCSDSEMMDMDGGFPLRFELQTLLGLRADQKRMRKREKARAREIGALLRLKLAGMGGVRSMSMPHMASSSSSLDATIVTPDHSVEETKLAARKVVELAAQMALRRRDAAGARPLLASNQRKGVYVHSPLMRTFGGSDEEDNAAHSNAMIVE